MQRALRFTLPNEKALRNTVLQANKACNLCLEWGHKHETYDKLRIHHGTYKKVRKTFPKLQSSLVCAVRDQASNMLKREKLKCLPEKRSTSSIRYNQRTFTFRFSDGKLSISTVAGRKRFILPICDEYQRYRDWKPVAATLSCTSQPILNIIVERPTPAKRPINTILGIDRGIRNIVVTSQGRFYNSRHLRNIKGKYLHMRKLLQRKGTRSAKRLLKKVSRREQRFVRDVNHCISRELINSDVDAIVVESLDVKHMRDAPRRLRKLIHRWSPSQLIQFLQYKAEELGKTIVSIDPRYTSQRCRRCGYTDKHNRYGPLFSCTKCGYTVNADFNAANNIAELGKTLLGGLTSTSRT